MSDTFSKSQRSQIMRSVRSTGTSAELRFEAVLRSLKIKFTRNVPKLPGKPDFVLKIIPVGRLHSRLLLAFACWLQERRCPHVQH